MKAPGFEKRAEILDRAKARIAESQVRYGNEVAYPADMELMLDLVGLIESLEMALSIEYSLTKEPRTAAGSLD
jgi:hypothetical protein